MKRLAIAVICTVICCAALAPAQDNALGLYFSGSTFTPATASAMVSPGFLTAAYIVLTNPTGAVIEGYEVGITCTAGDFGIPLTNLMFDTNLGSNVNQRVTFMSPKPALAGGTVLATVFLATASTDFEEISFGAAAPPSLPGDLPVVDYAGTGPVPCGQPWGTPAVAWLNGVPVSVEASTFGAVKAIFR
ncbi:MAG: hypothetical protein IPG61_04120 [bacterium]|nr:hypothetical protein [bacterium]MBK7671415.1 hypothetical protein [bacterium]